MAKYKHFYNRLKLTEEFLNEIEVLGGEGMTIEHLRFFYNVEENYFRRFCEKHFEIEEALFRGWVKKKRELIQKLIEKGVNGNVAALIFYLKTIGGLSENHTIGFVESSHVKMIPTKLGSDPVEASRIYQEIMK